MNFARTLAVAALVALSTHYARSASVKDTSADSDMATDNDDQLADYRKVLVAADQKAQEDFDKTIISLSGGGLAVSLVFLKDVIGLSAVIWPWALIAAWVFWGCSTLAVLGSYHFGQQAIRDGIKRIDEGRAYDEDWGGSPGRWTRNLNRLGAVLFFLGVLAILFFASANFYGKGTTNGHAQTAAASAAARAASSAASSSPPSSLPRGQGLGPS